MNYYELVYPKDEFWIGTLDEINMRRGNLLKILNIEGFQGQDKLEEENAKIKDARGPSDDLNVFSSLESIRGSIEAYENIEKFNQLGIKDYLLGKTSYANRHTRGAHSKGAALIGRIYFCALKPFIRYTVFKGKQDKFEKMVNFALYLHDVGHLPYSHMIEEIFNEINWTRIKGATHRHDEAPLEQLSKGEKYAITRAIKDSLNLSIEEDIEQSFEFVEDLIAGISGVPFLDAIVNSCLDADKIDYIFRDMEYTGTRARLREARVWLNDFLSYISLSPEGLVRLNGEASLCTLELLEERQFLYRNLYLDPRIRAFEKIGSVIVTSWLTKKISEDLLGKLRMDATSDSFSFSPDMRKDKGQLAYERIVKKFISYSNDNEMELLLNMCDELANDKYRDPLSKEWFASIKKRFESFRDTRSNEELVKQCNEMMVEEPFYIGAGEEVIKAREIARNIYIDYPCGVLIDIIELPRFLPTPKSRHFKIHSLEVVGETFLVPDEKPYKWSRSKIGKYPLHCCDFESLEKKFAQVLVINTMPGEVNGTYFLDLFVRLCRENRIEIRPLIWR